MNLIDQATEQGYTPEDILKYLSRLIPKMAPKVAQATASGYGVDQILKYVGRLMQDGKPTKGLSPHEIQAQKQKESNELGKKILGSAATGIGLTSVAKNIPNLIKGGVEGLQNTSNIGPTPMANAPVSPAVNATIPAEVVAPVVTNPIKEMGLDKVVTNLSEAGNDPATIAQAVMTTLKPHQKKWLEDKIKSGTAKPLPELITDFLSNEKKSPESAQKVLESAVLEPNRHESADLNKVKEVEKKPEKGSLVATPDGLVGEIKSERNGKALVDVDGKLHQVNSQDLELPNEEIREAVERLLNLPEVEKSSVLSSVVYRPSKKELFIKFHNGESYVYEEVEPELMQSVAEGMGIPVTTGKNFYGAWEKGKQDSRGAALIHDIIRNTKYAKSEEGKTWEKLETPYDRYKKLYKPSKRKKV